MPFLLKIEIITQTATLFIALFTQNSEHYSFLMILLETIHVYTQDGAIYPVNCTIPINTTIRLCSQNHRLSP